MKNSVFAHFVWHFHKAWLPIETGIPATHKISLPKPGDNTQTGNLFSCTYTNKEKGDMAKTKYKNDLIYSLVQAFKTF